jgi:hypothetical protein
LRRIAPTCLRDVPYNTFLRSLEIKITRYLQSHRTCDTLFL